MLKFLTLHRVCSAFLIALAGWTLAAQACVLLGWNLKALIACAPLAMALLFAAFYWIRHVAHGALPGALPSAAERASESVPETASETASKPPSESTFETASGTISAPASEAASETAPASASTLTQAHPDAPAVPQIWPARLAMAGLIALPVALALSFPLFLCMAVALAAYALCRHGGALLPGLQSGGAVGRMGGARYPTHEGVDADTQMAAPSKGAAPLRGRRSVGLRSAGQPIRPRNWPRLVVCCAVAIGIIASLAVVRGDLDDAYYVAVSAFSAAHPGGALLAGDPMFGDAGLPLIFPSYRFASFELLAAALAYLSALPAMDAYYIVLLPLWAGMAVLANFLLAKTLSPQRWLALGATALLLMLLLGEMPRAPANFSFVRLYQGKAVFVSVLVPLIFYLTARYAGKRGSHAELFLLACCQIGAIGLTNFGMLAAPLAGFGAIASNLPLFVKERKKLAGALAVLLIPLPFLIDVALQARGSAVFAQHVETGAEVWQSVFGKHQQYLSCLLLSAGPILAKDRITRWRLAVPPLLLFAVYLNPWFSAFIAMHLTTPPVYWRVAWSFPVLMYQAASLCLIVEAFTEQFAERLAGDIARRRKIVPMPSRLFALTAILLAAALPFSTLRPKNIGPFDGFAGWKAGSAEIAVARQAMAAGGDGTSMGRLLAPDEIAGLVSRFEEHPRLVNVRSEYVDALAPAWGQEAYRQRRVLTDFVLGRQADAAAMRDALRALDVSVVVIGVGHDTPDAVRLLDGEGYRRMDAVDAGGAYVIWRKIEL